MRDALLRQQKDQLLRPVAKQIFPAVHPNVVSLVAMVIGVVAAGAIWQGAYGAGLALWLLNRVLDGMDGLIARVHNKQSDFGGYLDLLLDFVVYLTVPIAFVAAAPTALNFWALSALLAVYVLNTVSWAVLSSLIEKRNGADGGRLTSVEMPTGLIEGAETIIFYTLFCLLPGYVAYLFSAMALLVLVTIGQRVVWAWENL